MITEGDYATIETAEEAAVVRYDSEINVLHDVSGWVISSLTRVTRAQVLEAITPKEGDSVLYFYNPPSASWGGPDPYKVYYLEKLNDIVQAYAVYIKANALTIGKTVGELQELLAWVYALGKKGDKDDRS